ncbi:MAG: hypothetical protein HC845_12355 [Akkermansiaceae bacterium]|nr:hypothetical protein [Akkermansiaceae bacterium]
MRTIYVDPTTKQITAAPIANSVDGLGEKLSEEDPSWHPFGFNRNLPAAADGFALSSPVLVMREGLRKITVILTLNFASTPPTDAELKTHFESGFGVKLSGEKDWVEAKVISATITNNSPASRKISLLYEIATGLPAIVPYNPTLLTGGYDTLAPIIRWETLTTAKPLVSLALSEATVQAVQIKVDVSGMKNVKLESDHGKLDASKPFYPFGPTPKIGSSFYIGADEALQKKVTAASMAIDWKSPPASLKAHYSAYPTLNSRENSGYTAQFQILRDGSFQDLTSAAKPLFNSANATSQITIDSSSPTLSFHKLGVTQYEKLFSRAVTQAKVELPFSRVSFSKPLSPLLTSPVLSFRAPLLLPFLPNLISLSAKTHSGFLRLKLNQDFGHENILRFFHQTSHTIQIQRTLALNALFLTHPTLQKSRHFLSATKQKRNLSLQATVQKTISNRAKSAFSISMLLAKERNMLTSSPRSKLRTSESLYFPVAKAKANFLSV